MTPDGQTVLIIIWTACGAIMTGILGLIFWGIKKLIVTMFENTIQIKILNGHIDNFLKVPPKVEKLERDMNIAHERIRGILANGEDT